MSESVLDSQLAEDNTPYYFPVSITKLILMGFATLGYYELYWFYKNWVIVKERENSDIRPFWRAIFAIFFTSPLFKQINSSASDFQVHGSFNPGRLAAAWVALRLVGLLLPAPFSLVFFFSALVLLPVQRVVNQINSQASPAHDPNARFSLANYLIISFVGFWLLFGLAGALLPSSDAIEHFDRGVENHQQGNYELAIEEYTEAIALDPELAEAYFNRGSAYSDIDEIDRAIADYGQVIVLLPQDAEAYLNRGGAYGVAGQLDRAISDLNRSIQIDDSADAYLLRGLFYSETGKPVEALSDIERALELGLDAEGTQIAEELLEELRR